MAKRDDLHNEANAGKGLVTALITGAFVYGAKAIGNSLKKEQLEIEFKNVNNEIEKLTQQINDEERKFFLARDSEKINSLKQARNQKMKRRDELIKEYQKI